MITTPELRRSQSTVLGVPIDNLTMPETLVRIEKLIEAGTFSYVVTPNVDHVMKLRSDASFRGIYRGASLVVPDGVPLLWASRLLGAPLQERINGTDLMVKLCELAARRGYSVFLLGGNRGTAEKAGARLKESLPDLALAGHHCPEMGFEKDPVQCRRIQKLVAASGADILFVGLGAPKQERWIACYGRGCNVALAIGIGVSFSFVAGEIRRAPRWMQRSGLEWFWRMLAEPRRLLKRYLVEDMPFVWLVAKAWLGKKTGTNGGA